MSLQPAVAGDIGDTRTIKLGGIDSLTGVTNVEAHVWRRSDTSKATLAAAVEDADECTVTVELGETGAGWLAADAEPGVYQFEIEATFGNGDVRTWPNGSPDTLTVRSQGD